MHTSNLDALAFQKSAISMRATIKQKIPFIHNEDERACFRGTTSIHWTFLASALITPTIIGASQ